MTIQAFGSAFSNGVMLALPLLLWLYGDKGGVPALLIMTLDGRRVQLGHRAARDRPTRRQGANWRIALQAWRAVALNPILMGTVFGILWRLSGLPCPRSSTGRSASSVRRRHLRPCSRSAPP
jgi:predicted permease